MSITDDRPRRKRREVVEADDGGGDDDDEMVAAIRDCDNIWMARIRMSIIHINAFFRCPDMILIH